MTTIILDTETHKLAGNACEIAWAPFSLVDGVAKSDFKIGECHRFNPLEPISIGAMATHHILDADVANCPAHTEFTLPILNHQPVEYIIGHNVDYDMAVLARCGIDISPIKTICTLALAQSCWPQAEQHTLGALAYLLAEDQTKAREVLKHAHSAWHDIRITASVLRYLIDDLGVMTVEELYIASEKARIPTHMRGGKHAGVPLQDLPPSYASWLRKQPDLNPYLARALDQFF